MISQRRGNASGRGAVNYIGQDGLGNIRALVKYQWADIDAYQYDTCVFWWVNMSDTAPFPVGAPGAPAATENNYLYAGERWDPSLGLYYLRARVTIIPTPDASGTWTATVALVNPPGLHKYL